LMREALKVFSVPLRSKDLEVKDRSAISKATAKMHTTSKTDTLGEYPEINYDSDLPTWRRDYREHSVGSRPITPQEASNWTFRESPKEDLRHSAMAFHREVARLVRSIQRVTAKVSRRHSRDPHLLLECVSQLNSRVQALENSLQPRPPDSGCGACAVF
jgi:hypothetical protein